MALRGTLGDFGIADIFQLVGHQTKTGVLLLKHRELEVRIFFVDGNVVKAEQTSRDKKDLLGNLMVRAQVLTEQQLEDALEQQQRTLRRLGQILLDTGVVDRETIRGFTRLQTTESIYRLFQWTAGTYEFRQEPVDYDEETYEPIGADTILMEGFRMVDEWPAVRRYVPSNAVTFVPLRPLPEALPVPPVDDEEDVMASLRAAFDDDEPQEPTSAAIGENERLVYGLVHPGRTVESIVDLSLLGEFETTKALANLVRDGYLQAHVPKGAGDGSSTRQPLTLRRLGQLTAPLLTRLALYAVVAASVGGIVRLRELDDAGLFARDRDHVVRHGAIQRALGEMERERLRRMVEVYRLTEGRYPEALAELATVGIADDWELRFPFRAPFAYRHQEDAVHLALPLR